MNFEDLKTLDEFPEKSFFYLFFYGGPCQSALKEVTVESVGNFEDYIRFLSCQLFS